MKKDPIEAFLQDMGFLYDPPEPPSYFPREIGIKLYNLHLHDELAKREFIWKYTDHTAKAKARFYQDNPASAYIDWSPRPKDLEKYLNLNDYEDVFKLKPIIQRAINGEEPEPEDLEAISTHLIERAEYLPNNPADPDDDFSRIYGTQPLPEDKSNRFIIREVSTDNDGRLRWKIYKWIYYVWALAIEVRDCEVDDCGKIFIPKRRTQKYHSEDCRERTKRVKDSESKSEDRIKDYQERAGWLAQLPLNTELEAINIALKLDEIVNKKLGLTGHQVGRMLGIKQQKAILEQQHGITYEQRHTGKQYLYTFRGLTLNQGETKRL